MINQEHGGNTYLYDVQYDFSANINPLGMPESIRRAVRISADRWEKYPDPYCTELTKKLSEYEKVPESMIVCGNGADDIIYRTAHALKPKKAVLCVPCFGEYKKALKESGCKITEYKLEAENNFDIGDDFTDYINSDTDLIFLGNPNNPTGRAITPELMRKILLKCRKVGAVAVFDECFIKFTANAEKLTAKNILSENVIVLNAFTKTHAMAGLRLGYAFVGHTEIAELIKKNGQHWSVSAAAQAAGIAAIAETEYIKNTVQLISQEREYLEKTLANLGFITIPSEANFILFRTEFQLDELLLKNKILIRNCNNYSGLDEGYFRIAVRTHEENKILVSAIRRILNG